MILILFIKTSTCIRNRIQATKKGNLLLPFSIKPFFQLLIDSLPRCSPRLLAINLLAVTTIGIMIAKATYYMWRYLCWLFFSASQDSNNARWSCQVRLIVSNSFVSNDRSFPVYCDISIYENSSTRSTSPQVPKGGI